MHRAILKWTINDFPMYDILFGWSTTRILECLICMEDIRAFTLKHGRKHSWFDCQICFLDIDHVYRSNKEVFYKNKVNRSPPLCRLISEEVWQKVQMISKVTYVWPIRLNGYGRNHNWMK